VITFVPLGGFLGAGKTTTMLAVARQLELLGSRVAVITNDQGADLVDTQLARAGGVAVGEVTGGCFCCRFEDLERVARQAVDDSGADVIIAEAVGSCTDLQATVVRPLQQRYGEDVAVAPLTTVLDPSRYDALIRSLPLRDEESDLAYLFRHQLQEADVIAVNKVDLLAAAETERIVADLRRRFPGTTVAPYSALTGHGLDDLLRTWQEVAAGRGTADIDYDRYAAAEAQLAWLNRALVVAAADGFRPDEWAAVALGHLSEIAAQRRWTIGHAKVGIESAAGLTKLSVTSAGAPAVVDVAVSRLAGDALAVFNARVACEPAELDAAAEAAIAAADAATGARSTSTGPTTAFKPGYPRPVHRIAAEVA
jgi:Ni2+-binding GTPase involved in maturation of urease and hydrogenase